ncbi:MAG: lipoyl synthase [Clostridiales Family XIII bacterium]|jgi:lipoic acid synthetase|nr:lipoyl synthase [Clostridiales Family XIII bacterium]
MLEKPDWIRRRHRANPRIDETERLLEEFRLNTICREADCPNHAECFSKKTATFLILGVHCTRNCAFCNVTNAPPRPVDPGEPARVGAAIARLGLKYVVITSVTRDDLPDGGSAHFAAVVAETRLRNPETLIEVLIPDFGGVERSLRTVIEAEPDVIGHNMETVRELYARVRPEADYDRSLRVIGMTGALAPAIPRKSGFMLGLGETEDEVAALMDDLRRSGCEFLTIGQYLAPSARHLDVVEYVSPDRFAEYGRMARDRGFTFVVSAPFARSSYRAEEALGL